jgi:hypothetical protein
VGVPVGTAEVGLAAIVSVGSGPPGVSGLQAPSRIRIRMGRKILFFMVERVSIIFESYRNSPDTIPGQLACGWAIWPLFRTGITIINNMEKTMSEGTA